MNIERVEQLIGWWQSDPEDAVGRAAYGDVTMNFRADSRLVHRIRGSRDQVIVLSYRLAEGHLVTDQPSSPKEETSAIFLDDKGRLIIDYETTQARFVKMSL